MRATCRTPTEREIFGTLRTLAEKSGWPIPDTLVATVVAAALRENDGREVSTEQVEAARATMRPRQNKLEVTYNRSLSIPLALMDVVKRLEGIYTDG